MDVDPLHECQRVAEARASGVGQADTQERVRHGLERRLGGYAYDVVIKGAGFNVLSGRLDESSDPVIHKLLAALVKFPISAAELWRTLLPCYNGDRREAQPQRAHESRQDAISMHLRRNRQQ